MKPNTLPISSLLERMRAGDRAAAAEFVIRYGRMVRLRLRSRLGVDLRRVFDSEDLLSTVARRLDTIVLGRRLRAESEAQLWALVGGIASNAVAEHHRQRTAPMTCGSAVCACEEPKDESQGDCSYNPEFISTIKLDALLRDLADDVDRIVLLMRVRGATHVQIAGAVGLSPSAVRMRWHRLRRAARRSRARRPLAGGKW